MMSVIENMKFPLIFEKATISLPEIEDIKVEVVSESEDEGNICTTCGKMFDSPSQLKRHLSLSHFRKPIQEQFAESFARLQVIYLV